MEFDNLDMPEVVLGKPNEEIMELCKSFWASERGKEIIRKSREVPILRKEGGVSA